MHALMFDSDAPLTVIASCVEEAPMLLLAMTLSGSNSILMLAM